MKRILSFALACALLLALGTTQTLAGTPENKAIRCSTTTSVNDTGLLPFLQPDFEASSGYELIVVSNGSGAAIKLGESGDADVLLVHSKAAEEEFVANGYGISRISFMHNYFVVIGPASDPAGISECENAAEAFAAIADAECLFVSRGDESGTHTAERRIWAAVGIEPGEQDSWYISAGAGMGASLNQANEREAYILSDKATFLSMQDNLELGILLEKGEDMKNVYSLIACNPDKNPGLNAEGAQAFIDYMTDDATLAKIAGFGEADYGQVLFYAGE